LSNASDFIIMKRTGLIIIITTLAVINITGANAQADTTFPASAIWELSNPSTGGTGLTAATAGNIAAGEESFGSNTQMRDYTGWGSSLINIKRMANTPESVAIHNLKGQKVLEINLNSEDESIDITSLPQGVYILKFRNLSYKLVVN
jgi:hypothetical protein